MSKRPSRYRRHRAARRRPSPKQPSQAQSAGDTASLQAIKTATRLHLRSVWEIAQYGGTLNAEDTRTAQVMREHSEWADLWPRLDTVSDAELERDGYNPVTHLMIHTTLENQLADNDPPITGEVLTALMAQGMSRHEAMHRMGEVVAEEIFNIMKHHRPFDEVWFERELRRLI